MRRSLFVLLAVMVSIPLANCGGGGGPQNPIGPTPPVPEKATFVFTDAESGAPIPNLSVQVGAATHTTGSDGKFTIDKPAARTALVVDTPAFARHDSYADWTEHKLVPNTLDDQGYRDMGFREDVGATDKKSVDSPRAVPYSDRPGEVPTYYVVLDPAFQGEYPAARFKGGAAAITAFAGDRVRLEVVNEPRSSMNITTRHDPKALDAFAGGYNSSEFRITGGSITLREVPYPNDNPRGAERAIAHELLHALGIHHLVNLPGVMNNNFNMGRSEFTDMEKRIIRTLLTRRPGTTWKDDERNAK